MHMEREEGEREREREREREEDGEREGEGERERERWKREPFCSDSPEYLRQQRRPIRTGKVTFKSTAISEYHVTQ